MISKIISKKKEKIIMNFVELFNKYGLEKLSLGDVAEKSGLTKSALYYYFDSKDALVVDGIKYFYEKMNEKFHKLLEPIKTPRDVLKCYCSFFFKVFSGEYDEFRSLMEYSLETTFDFTKYALNSPNIVKEIIACKNEEVSFLSGVIADYFHADKNDKRIIKMTLLFSNILQIFFQIREKFISSKKNDFLSGFEYKITAPITFEESFAFVMSGLDGLGREILGKSRDGEEQKSFNESV